MTFLADASDPIGGTMGLHTYSSVFSHAYAMMEEVIERWPTDEEEQRTIYRDDEDVRLGTNMGVFP